VVGTGSGVPSVSGGDSGAVSAVVSDGAALSTGSLAGGSGEVAPVLLVAVELLDSSETPDDDVQAATARHATRPSAPRRRAPARRTDCGP